MNPKTVTYSSPLNSLKVLHSRLKGTNWSKFSKFIPVSSRTCFMHPCQVMRFNEHQMEWSQCPSSNIQFYRLDLNDFTSQRHFSALHKANVIAIIVDSTQIKYYISRLQALFQFPESNVSAIQPVLQLQITFVISFNNLLLLLLPTSWVHRFKNDSNDFGTDHKRMVCTMVHRVATWWHLLTDGPHA